jgi:hypothetical protein
VRQKIFGMVGVPLDRNDKARLLHRARAMMRAEEPGRAYGLITAKTYAVLAALLLGFHNAGSGRCFPSYDRIQEAAGCCRQTVATALAALEATGLLTVCNRLLRVRWKDEEALAMRVRVVRTSNCYSFPSTSSPAPGKTSKSSFQTGTGIQVSNPDLSAALDRLKDGLRDGKSQNSCHPADRMLFLGT